MDIFIDILSKDNNTLESTAKTIDEDDIPTTRILDQYSLEFLDLSNNYSEKDLRKSIVSNLKDFILEIGNDFTFVGEEYRVQVGNRDFYIDLLFYNRTYSCLVAFELKIIKAFNHPSFFDFGLGMIKSFSDDLEDINNWAILDYDSLVYFYMGIDKNANS